MTNINWWQYLTWPFGSEELIFKGNRKHIWYNLFFLWMIPQIKLKIYTSNRSTITINRTHKDKKKLPSRQQQSVSRDLYHTFRHGSEMKVFTDGKNRKPLLYSIQLPSDSSCLEQVWNLWLPNILLTKEKKHRSQENFHLWLFQAFQKIESQFFNLLMHTFLGFKK